MSGTYVIGVAAPAGGGKSTLVDALAGRLTGSRALLFDDYDIEMPGDWSDWLARGADFNEWQVGGLQADLFDMKRSEGSSPWVLFEAPLGRAHTATGSMIDFVVYIDTPLEVALARWLRRRLAESTPEAIAGYVSLYENVLRDVYLEQRRQVRPSADLVLDGLASTDIWADQVLAALPGVRVSRE